MREAGGTSLTDAQRIAAAAGQKGMMPLSGADGRARPFLDYLLSALADAGFTDVALVVAPPPEQGPDPVREYYAGAGQPARLHVSFVVQPTARGTADAVVAAAEWIGPRPFVVVNGDNLYDPATLRALRECEGPAFPVYQKTDLIRDSGIPEARIGSFALVTLTPDGFLADIVEKPGDEAARSADGNAGVSMNCWKGDAAVMQACRDVPVSSRGEFELPNAIRLAVTRGVRVRGIAAQGPVLDLSRRDDIAQVTHRLRHVEARP